jgi:hypothetical protein
MVRTLKERSARALIELKEGRLRRETCGFPLFVCHAAAGFCLAERGEAPR